MTAVVEQAAFQHFLRRDAAAASFESPRKASLLTLHVHRVARIRASSSPFGRPQPAKRRTGTPLTPTSA